MVGGLHDLSAVGRASHSGWGSETAGDRECGSELADITDPEGPSPSTQYLRLLVPTAIPFMVFGTRVLKYWVLGPLGRVSQGLAGSLA